MAAFLFVTASIAVAIGLAGIIAAHLPRTVGRQQGPCAAVEPR